MAWSVILPAFTGVSSWMPRSAEPFGPIFLVCQSNNNQRNYLDPRSFPTCYFDLFIWAQFCRLNWEVWSCTVPQEAEGCIFVSGEGYVSCGNMCSVTLSAKRWLRTYKIQVICSLKKDIVSDFFMIRETRRQDKIVLTHHFFKISSFVSAEAPESPEHKLCTSQAHANGANSRPLCTLCHWWAASFGRDSIFGADQPNQWWSPRIHSKEYYRKERTKIPVMELFYTRKHFLI